MRKGFPGHPDRPGTGRPGTGGPGIACNGVRVGFNIDDVCQLTSRVSNFRSCLNVRVGNPKFPLEDGSMPLRSHAYSLRRWLSAATPAKSAGRQITTLARAMPLLSAETSSGVCMYSNFLRLKSLMFVVEDISEEELYKYRRNRWMFVRNLSPLSEGLC
jgi:hypothetical protein